jgi:hypothetical protein
MTNEKTSDKRLATAYEQLKKAAYLTELACESLSPVEGQAERWERVRSLMFSLRKERDALFDLCGMGQSA